jgi:hypothetical protein
MSGQLADLELLRSEEAEAQDPDSAKITGEWRLRTAVRSRHVVVTKLSLMRQRDTRGSPMQ